MYSNFFFHTQGNTKKVTVQSWVLKINALVNYAGVSPRQWKFTSSYHHITDVLRNPPGEETVPHFPQTLNVQKLFDILLIYMPCFIFFFSSGATLQQKLLFPFRYCAKSPFHEVLFCWFGAECGQLGGLRMTR